MWLFLTPYPQITCHGACAIQFLAFNRGWTMYLVSKTSTARDLKFGTQTQSGNMSKTAKKNLEKGRRLGHVTPINFGVHLNVSRKRVELETWNLIHRCIVAISRKPAKKNPEKARSLGHVTPKCLANNLTFVQNVHSGNISKTRKEKSRKRPLPGSRDP